ncbi:MAG: hypothetical protein ABIH67_02170 [Candidatus Uhrbacteria bacterium]
MNWLKPSGTCILGERQSNLSASTFDALIRPGHLDNAWRVPVEELELFILNTISGICRQNLDQCKQFDRRMEQYANSPLLARVIIRLIGLRPNPRQAPPSLTRDQMITRYVKQLDQQRAMFKARTNKSQKVHSAIKKCRLLSDSLKNQLSN